MPIPTTMLLRLVVVPARVVTVVLPLVAVAGETEGQRLVRLVHGRLDGQRHRVPLPIEETVVEGEVGIPELPPVTTIPTATPVVLATVNVLVEVCRFRSS